MTSLVPKLFKVEHYVSPEYGSNYEQSENYYISLSMELVINQIKVNHNVDFDIYENRATARKYYTYDRCESVWNIFELEVTIL
jgi:hypothetical protein